MAIANTMKVALGKFACSCIEARFGTDLHGGVQAALRHYTRRLESAINPIAVPVFCRDQAPDGSGAEFELVVEPKIESALEREARRQAVGMEQIWTGIEPQGDGSYWGLHQWYFATEECVSNPTLGLTAWRVLHTASGSRFLRVCFSEPGSGSQPTIAPDGTAAHATFGCVDSALISPLPVVKPDQFGEQVTLPSNKTCFGRSQMRIRVRDPKNDPIKTVLVTLHSGKVTRRAKLKRHHAAVTATLSLKGLSAGTFTVTVKVVTVLGNHLAGKRKYHSCPKKLRPPHPHHHRH